ncbi:MAG TPA: hypothetical protein VK797_28005 [Tepidisphaeraceae bacterium]|nr:hypothetical protein [Tepidisphaeraceae bacterium]
MLTAKVAGFTAEGAEGSLMQQTTFVGHFQQPWPSAECTFMAASMI